MIKIITISVILLSFSSCKKCKTCTTITTQNVYGVDQNVSTSEEYCGKDYDNAPADSDVTNNVGGVDQHVVISCKES